MKIHHWKMSETLKRYSTGDIIILAEDADAARAKVIIRTNVKARTFFTWGTSLRFPWVIQKGGNRAVAEPAFRILCVSTGGRLRARGQRG